MANSGIGPFDSHEIDAVRQYIDFGSIRVEPVAGLSVAVEIEPASGRIAFVTLDNGDSKLQVVAHAAPKSDGIWTELRNSTLQSIVAQGGSAEESVGPLGVQLDAKLPLVDEQGRPSGFRMARFVGFDGPRWCLRGTIGGLALGDLKAEADIVDLFRAIVVHRGDEPMPPGQVLPLSYPEGAVLPPGLNQG